MSKYLSNVKFVNMELDLEEARRQELKAEIKALEEAKQREITALEEERRQKIKDFMRALEFIGSTIQSQDETISVNEPTNNVLMRLTQDAKFISYLKRTCSLNDFQYKDVETCISKGSIYHTALRNLYGSYRNVGIDARDWSVNEVLAL
ncbi:5039_t:CDS:2, partial [Paraglomus occultum]